MTNRYGNFICFGGGLWEAVRNFLQNPGFALTQLTLDDGGGRQDKLLYLLQLFVPLGLLPFGAKKPSRLLLLLPAVLVNFMTVYVYQYDIGFQYSFGSMAFLLYGSLLNAGELRPETARLTVSFAALACLLFTLQGPLPRLTDYAAYYAKNRTDLEIMETRLASLPEDASVACATTLVPHLARHEILYETYYHDPTDGRPPDFVIFTAGTPENEIAPYTAAGFTLRETVTNGDRALLVIYQKQLSAPASPS